MLEFVYWLSSILVTILFGFGIKKYMNKVQGIKIKQQASRLQNVKGANFQLGDGEDIHIKGMDIEQTASEMKDVVGLEFTATGSQSARLQGVRVKQPHGEIRISDDPNVEVRINSQV